MCCFEYPSVIDERFFPNCLKYTHFRCYIQTRRHIINYPAFFSCMLIMSSLSPSSRYLIPFLAISVTHHLFSSLPLPIQDMVHFLFRHLPKDVRNRRLREGRISVSTTTLSLRAASRLHDVPYATLRRHILSGGNISVQGRHLCLHPAEEKLIADAALHFALNGTPLSLECLKYMMQHFIQ